MFNFAYVGRRLVFAVITFLLASSAVYFILNIIPGDIAYRILGDFATEETLAELRAELGTDRPIPVRYAEWLGNLVRGDLGVSAFSREPIIDLIRRKLSVTLELTVLATAIGIFVGIPAGITSAIRSGTVLDAIVRPVSIIGIAAPSFWIALLVLLTPSLLWNYAPPRYVSLVSDPVTNLQLMLPAAMIVGFEFTASITRVSRTTMLEVIREDYVRTAYSKGLSERTVLMRHALRNSLIPVLTLISFQFAMLLGGTVIIETIFSLPGLGQHTILSITRRDYPMVQGFVVFTVFVYVTVSLFVDLAASVLDPRIRFSN